MKRFFLFALVATVFAACSTDTTQDLAPEIPTAPDELQVSFDEEDTRIQLGENGAPVWTKGDLISVFYRTNANSKYQFTGETGDVDGTIKLVEEGVATQQTTQIVAVYPYSTDYWFNWNTYNVEAFLPAEQTYCEDSFGVGSSIMVSSSEYKSLAFKNVCGWIKLQFTGNQIVETIAFKGNNGEQVAGEIYINTSDASCELASGMGSGEGVGGFIEEEGNVLTEVTLNCGEYGVQLDKNTPTAFYIALPPQTFEKGFTATIYGCNGSTKEISTNKTITIERNHILPMASASATLEMPIANNVIWYTSSDGNVIEPNATDVFGANITSNTYENGVGVITFDGDVTTIGDWAFYNCKALTSVTIPNSVTTIGDWAFRNCYALTSITIPDSVTTIGDGAFLGCDALKAFYGKFASEDNRCLIVDGVLKSFAIGCGLTEYTIPDSVTTIGEWAFDNCDALTSVTIPDSVTTIGNYAFYDCDALTSVTIPDSVTTIGNYAFRDCSALTSVTIPDSVTTIGSGAFAACDALKTFYGKFASADNRCLIVDGVLNSFAPAGLTEYTIPDSVTMIGRSAFQDCSALTSVTIPDSVTTIGSYAFRDCTALKEVYCKPTTPPSLSLYVFNNNASNRKIYVPTASVDAYKAADGWKEYADAIVAMPIPSNQIWYTSSNGNVVEPYKTDVFGANITSNTYENGVGVITFDGDVTTIGDYAFRNCSSLTSVTIPNSVTTIGNYAFQNCSALTSVTIPDSVTTIGHSAFEDCSALISVTIPNSVTEIGENAFWNCTALTSVTIPDSVTTIGGSAFASCDALKAFYGKFASKDNRCLIVNGVLNSFAPAGLTEYTIPDSVTTIGGHAFKYCSSLTSVTIPDSVTTIGSSAFYNCSALKEVYCEPTTPPSLGNSYVFDNNASDRKIYVPTASVDAYKAASRWSEYADAIVAMPIPIPNNQICYTSSDGNVVAPNKTDVFGANIVSNTYENGVGVITFDGDITTIGEEAFYYCSSLTSVTIPDSVTKIEKKAFYYSKALTSVTIGDGVTEIGEEAFASCDALKEVYCKPTTPPALKYVNKKVYMENWPAATVHYYVFYIADDLKIYVPTDSYDVYTSYTSELNGSTAQTNWFSFKSYIEPYEF